MTKQNDIDNSSWLSRALALSAIGNCVYQVDRLAKTGGLDTELFEQTVAAIFRQNPKRIEEIYQPLSQLESGNQLVLRILNNRDSKNSYDTTRYIMSLLFLQKKLQNRPDLLEVIANRLEESQRQLDHFDLSHETVVAKLAEIYSETISTFNHRIQVKGDPNTLQQNRIANQVRTLLLAGIRAAVLWQQSGGSRLQLIFRRGKIITSLQALKRYF